MAATRICPQCGTETQASFCRVDGFATVDAARYAGPDPSRREGGAVGGRYRLDQLIGRSALGWTYRATDLRLHAPVAVRLIAPVIAADLGLVARFQREGRLVASLAHPNIVHVLEHGVDEDGTLFIAEELVTGPTLAEALARSGPFEPARVVAIGRELFDALTEAHAHGVLHRSLGLDNVALVARAGGGETIKVGDFGLVQVLADDAAGAFVYPPALTNAWQTMAPEQARGRGVSGHADLYSAGALMYALLAGRPVFSATSPSDLLVAHSVRLPPPIERDGRIVAGPLVDLIMRCLDKKPWNRPDGAQKALDMLEQCRVQPVVALAPATAEFAAPAAGTRAATRPNKRPSTNPYAPSPEPRAAAAGDVPASPPTDVAGAARPGRPTRLLVNTVPEIAAAAARPAEPPIPPTAPAPHALPSAVVTRAEVLDREVAMRRRDWDEPAPRRRSPALWFVAGMVVAGLLAVAAVLLLAGPLAPTAGTLALAEVETRPAAAPGASAPSTPSEGGGQADALVVQPAAAGTAAGPDAASTTGQSDAGPDTGLDARAVAGAVDAGRAEDGALDTLAGAQVAVGPGDVEVRGEDGGDAARASAARDAETPLEAPAVDPATERTEPAGKAKKPRAKGERRVADPLADLEDPEFGAGKVSDVREDARRSVLVESEPIGASVLLGGRPLGVTPMYVEWSGTDSVGVVIEKVGYRSAYKRLGPSTGRGIRVTLVPEP